MSAKGLQRDTNFRILGAGHALGRLAGWRAHSRLRSRSGRILRSALCLEGLGMKHAVFSEAAFRESLRIILERVGRRLRSGVAHREAQILFDENELHVRAAALNRTRLHIAGNTKALAVGA